MICAAKLGTGSTYFMMYVSFYGETWQLLTIYFSTVITNNKVWSMAS